MTRIMVQKFFDTRLIKFQDCSILSHTWKIQIQGLWKSDTGDVGRDMINKIMTTSSIKSFGTEFEMS